MKINKFVAALAAAMSFMGAWAKDYYVDANNGNDEWDGTVAAIPDQAAIDAAKEEGTTVSGPRKTLHSMMSDERVVAGDTVNAAEGDYCEGGVVYSDRKTVNRVQVKAGVMLKATGARNATFITGSGGSYNSGAYSNGAVRCVYFLSAPSGASYARGIVKGFTLRDGRTAPTWKNSSGGEENEYGGGATGGSENNGLLVECDLIGNGCYLSSRGGTINGITALRCHFISSDRSYLGYNATVIDSLISVGSAALLYNACYAYNCTFDGNSFMKHSGRSYNCLFIGTGAASSNQDNASGKPANHFNNFSRSEFHAAASKTNETCRVVTAAETPYDETTFRPSVFSVAIDAGDLSHYAQATNNWTAAWLAECGKDYCGGERVVNGKIDVGCGEMQMRDSVARITDEGGALLVEGAVNGEAGIPEGSTKDITFARTFTSDKLCLGVDVGGVFYSFGGTTGNVPQTVSMPWRFGHDYIIAAVYEEDQKEWYVSPMGDDNNKGYHKDCPRRTLAKVMELAKENSGNVVHAAAGVYNEGGIANSSATTTNRVVIKEGVGLVADAGAEQTVIEGYVPTVEDTNYISTNGGVMSVRCVYMQPGAWIKDFTLRNGSTKISEPQTDSTKSYGDYGGGVYGGTAIGCVISNCYAVRGGGAARSTLIRCRLQGCNYVRGKSFSGQGKAQNTGTTAFRCNAYGSHIAGMITSQDGSPDNILVNCFLGGTVSRSKVYNSYCGEDQGNNVMSNSVVKSGKKTSTVADEATRFSVNSVVTDELKRPSSVDSVLVNRGDNRYLALYPEQFAEQANYDLAGGQRVYDGTVDVGAGEYDWRGHYSGKIDAKGKVEVASADPDVVLADEGLDIKAGSTLRLRVNLALGGMVEIRLSADALVKANGAEVQGVDGVYAFNGEEETVYDISISAEADAVLSSVKLPKSGTVVVVK